jgi:hypothetical protein
MLKFSKHISSKSQNIVNENIEFGVSFNKDSLFDPCGHRCTCYACGMRYLPMIQWQQMIPFADVLVVCWWGYKQLGHG